MSLGNILVSDCTSSICDEDESKFVVLGEIKWEYIPKIRSEPGRMREPGMWKFRIKGNFIEAFDRLSQGGNKAFRVLRENGETLSTEGFACRGPTLLDGEIYELEIQASGKRV